MLTSGRWAIVAMGIFVTTAAIAVAQSRGVVHLVESVRSSDSSSPFGSSADASSAQSAEDFLWAGTLSGGQALEVSDVPQAMQKRWSVPTSTPQLGQWFIPRPSPLRQVPSAR